MSNPFENDESNYLVLVNNENQHSLWPDFIAPPAGWQIKHGPEKRQSCINYINEHWTDMRPLSLINNK
jgi:MbtH protein